MKRTKRIILERGEDKILDPLLASADKASVVMGITENPFYQVVHEVGSRSYDRDRVMEINAAGEHYQVFPWAEMHTTFDSDGVGVPAPRNLANQLLSPEFKQMYIKVVGIHEFERKFIDLSNLYNALPLSHRLTFSNTKGKFRAMEAGEEISEVEISPSIRYAMMKASGTIGKGSERFDFVYKTPSQPAEDRRSSLKISGAHEILLDAQTELEEYLKQGKVPDLIDPSFSWA